MSRPLSYDDTPRDGYDPSDVHEAMRSDRGTGRHAPLLPPADDRPTIPPEVSDRLQGLEDEIHGLKTRITTAAVGIAAIMGVVMTVCGWVLTTVIDTRQQAAINRDRIDGHAVLAGHERGMSELGDIRSDQRAMDAGVRSELAAINRRLDDIATVLNERRQQR